MCTQPRSVFASHHTTTTANPTPLSHAIQHPTPNIPSPLDTPFKPYSSICKWIQHHTGAFNPIPRSLKLDTVQSLNLPQCPSHALNPSIESVFNALPPITTTSTQIPPHEHNFNPLLVSSHLHNPTPHHHPLVPHHMDHNPNSFPVTLDNLIQ